MPGQSRLCAAAGVNCNCCGVGVPPIVLLGKEDAGQFAILICGGGLVGKALALVVHVLEIQAFASGILCRGDHHQARLEFLQHELDPQDVYDC